MAPSEHSKLGRWQKLVTTEQSTNLGENNQLEKARPPQPLCTYYRKQKRKRFPSATSLGVKEVHVQGELEVELVENETPIEGRESDQGENINVKGCQGEGDENGHSLVACSSDTQKRRGRGPTKKLDVHTRNFVRRVVIPLNAENQPIGERQRELSSFLGTLSRMQKFCPLTIPRWSRMNKADKNVLWDYVQKRYIIPESGKKWVLQTIGSLWRGYKHRLRKRHYYRYETDEMRWANRPNDIPEDVFSKLLVMWSSEDSEKLAEVNKRNSLLPRKTFASSSHESKLVTTEPSINLRKNIQLEKAEPPQYLSTYYRKQKRKRFPSATTSLGVKKVHVQEGELQVEFVENETPIEGRESDQGENINVKGGQGEGNENGYSVVACGSGTQKKRGRGPTKKLDVHTRNFVRRVVISLNAENQPIGERQRELSSFLGTLSRMQKFCPLTIPRWSRMNKADKNVLWDYVQKRYIIPESGKKWVLQTIGSLWRGYKHRLRKNHYYRYETDEMRWANRPNYIPEDVFSKLLDMWSSEDSEKLAEVNKRNSLLQKNSHTCGKKRLHVSRGHNEPPSTADMFTATCEEALDGNYEESYVDINSKIDRIIETELQQGQANNDVNASPQMGPEHSGCLRVEDRGVTAKNTEKAVNSSSSVHVSKECLETIKEEIATQVTKDVTLRLAAVLQKLIPGLNIDGNALASLLAETPSPVDASATLGQMRNVGSSITPNHTPNHVCQGDSTVVNPSIQVEVENYCATSRLRRTIERLLAR